MPNFLTIDTVNYEVLTDKASEDAPAVGGLSVEWAWDNSPQITVSPERRVRSFGLGLTSMAAYEAMRAIALLSPRAVGGPAYNNVTKQRIIIVESADYIPNGTDFMIQGNITITDAES